MRYLPLICILLLSACKSTIPSQAIANNAINELKGVTEAVEHIKATTPAQCKSDTLTANLNAIKTQIDSVSGQIKNIDLACKSEKETLRKDIVIHRMIIGILATLLGIVVFLLIRFKK